MEQNSKSTEESNGSIANQAQPESGSENSIWRDVEPEDQTDLVKPIEHASVKQGDWLLFGASRRGRSHAHSGTYREDAFALRPSGDGVKPSWWVLAVADGAGSCRLSRVGANLAVKEVTSYLALPYSLRSAPRKRLQEAVFTALRRLEREAEDRSCDVKDLSCTLLAMLWIEDEDTPGGKVFTFQAGDGLMAVSDHGGQLRPLAEQDGEAFAGTTHFFTGDHVWNSWDSRFSEFTLEEAPLGFLAMTDGVSDDLVPYSVNGPIIVKELRRISECDGPGEALVELLGYEKRGSFDDRTLVCAMIRECAGFHSAACP